MDERDTVRGRSVGFGQWIPRCVCGTLGAKVSANAGSSGRRGEGTRPLRVRHFNQLHFEHPLRPDEPDQSMSQSKRAAHLQCQPGVRSAYKFEACGVVLQRAVFKEPGVYWLLSAAHERSRGLRLLSVEFPNYAVNCMDMHRATGLPAALAPRRRLLYFRGLLRQA